MLLISKLRTIWTKCRSPYVFVLLCCVLLTLYLLDSIDLSIYPIRLNLQTVKKNTTDFLIKTTGCRIPFLDPYDKSILQYIRKVKPFKCGKAPLVNSDRSTLYLDVDQLKNYNVDDLNLLQCCVQPFWRINPPAKQSDNMYQYGRCKVFNRSVHVDEEFVRVLCKSNGTEVYKDFHSFVPIKYKKETPSFNKLNVLIIGLDSMSRLNFQRQMPKTRKFLQEELKAIELNGYNKVGDNTFPNLIPVLTGLSVKELEHICWFSVDTKFDNCPFIWKNFSQAGYVTAYGEDSAWMGMFNYLKQGFQKQPTDYYWHTFDFVAEQEIGHNKPYNADLCVGPRPIYKELLNYVVKFVESFPFQNYFGFFWGTSLTHDNLNYPAQGDDAYLEFFRKLKESEVWSRTVLIVLSDHGIRWGDIRSTQQGHLEERLPFLMLAFPDWFELVYPAAVANLKQNAYRLTTPFDLHETIRDLLDVEQLLANRSVNSNAKETTLFLPVPENRTCSSAGIASHWCTCQSTTHLDKNNRIVSNAADFILEHLNSLLTNYKSCAYLHLDEVVEARLSISGDYLQNILTIRDYTIIVKTVPGNGLFEGTVRCVDCVNNSFKLSGTISRLNFYGKQSACVQDFQLKLYCYCIS